MIDINGKNGVSYITFPQLSKFSFVRHAFSTRLGGESEGHFSSMNLSFSVGENRNTVLKNYEKFCSAAGFNRNSIVGSSQQHETNVKAVTKDDIDVKGIKGKGFSSVDALVTNEKNVTIVTYHADCVPLYFLDPEKKAIGLAHAGWRGTAGLIAEKTAQKMVESFSCEKSDIICVIGPCICKCCYEVDKNVADEFLKLGLKNAKILKKKNDKYMLDLVEANREILINFGLSKDKIFSADVCTSCNYNFLFSHRATDGKRGTMAAMMCIVD